MAVCFLNTFEDLCCFRQSEHKTTSHSAHQPIAFIGEGSQNEQNCSSNWFDVAILYSKM
jgi:hypothetical protein